MTDADKENSPSRDNGLEADQLAAAAWVLGVLGGIAWLFFVLITSQYADAAASSLLLAVAVTCTVGSAASAVSCCVKNAERRLRVSLHERTSQHG